MSQRRTLGTTLERYKVFITGRIVDVKVSVIALFREIHFLNVDVEDTYVRCCLQKNQCALFELWPEKTCL